jgi:CBS domain-containing protein
MELVPFYNTTSQIKLPMLEIPTMPVIRDVMNKCEVTFQPECTLIGAVEVLCKHHLSGAPVVAANGDVVGFITETDLMDVLFDKSARSTPISAYMSDGTYAVGPDESIAAAAAMFALYGVRRLPVVENGSLVGVITRRDLLQFAIRGSETINDPLIELIPAVGEYA